MTLSELIEQLEDLQTGLGDDVDPEVRLAHQPRWAFEYEISGEVLVGKSPERTEPPVGFSEDKAVEVEDGDQDGTISYIGEGTQLGYLSGVASKELGWR